MKTRTRNTIEHERQHTMRAPSLVSCFVSNHSTPRTRGFLMIDIYPPLSKKRVRARKSVRPLTIWNYLERHRGASLALRSLALLLIIALNAYALRSVGVTAAYYLDGESLRGNSYVAGSVDFALSGTPYSPPASALGMDIGATATRTIAVIPEQGTNTFWYHASSTNLGADLDFCEALSLKSSLEGVENYSGLLKDFVSPATTMLSNWQFDVTTNSALYNKVCTFDLEYTAWQERHNVPGFTEMGYHDTEKEANKIASKGLRLNKIYYDVAESSTPPPCAKNSSSFVETMSTTPCTSSTSTSTPPSRGSEGWNEWVEVYNQTNVEQNITGWSICDNTSCDVIPRTAIIPPFGFALITASSTTLSLWNIPPTFPSAILPDGTIGDGLDNDNDMLILKRPDGMIVDQMNYGENPYAGWVNYNSDVWTPGTIDIPEGGVLARNPTGYDTDQPSDWTGFGVPTITLLNPSSSSGGTWDWGAPHDIQWTATNPNGPNTDLLVDIYAIKDTDGTRTITPADLVMPIVIGTENDGIYHLDALMTSSGYFWIEVVAIGIENVLLNDADYSGKLFGSSSSLCKSYSSKSGCGDNDDRHSKDDEEYDSDKEYHGDDYDNNDKKHDDDKKYNDVEGEHDDLVKDSLKHKEEDSGEGSHAGLVVEDREKVDSNEALGVATSETSTTTSEILPDTSEKVATPSSSEKLPEADVVKYAKQPEEPASLVTVFKKEEELAVVAKESSSEEGAPEQTPVIDQAPTIALAPEAVVEQAVVTE